MAELKQRAFSLLRKPAEKGRQTHGSPATQHEDFAGHGVDFSVKLVGKRVLPVARGETMAHAAMTELKQEQQASGAHKQKMVINLSLSGIKLCDEKSQNVYVEHPIKNISFITIEPEDPKWFAYIAAEKAQGTKHTFMLYCLKSEKQAPAITASMMRLFKFAHRLHKQQQQQQGLHPPQQQHELQERALSSSGTQPSRTTVSNAEERKIRAYSAAEPTFPTLLAAAKSAVETRRKHLSLAVSTPNLSSDSSPEKTIVRERRKFRSRPISSFSSPSEQQPGADQRPKSADITVKHSTETAASFWSKSGTESRPQFAFFTPSSPDTDQGSVGSGHTTGQSSNDELLFPSHDLFSPTSVNVLGDLNLPEDDPFAPNSRPVSATSECQEEEFQGKHSQSGGDSLDKTMTEEFDFSAEQLSVSSHASMSVSDLPVAHHFTGQMERADGMQDIVTGLDKSIATVITTTQTVQPLLETAKLQMATAAYVARLPTTTANAIELSTAVANAAELSTATVNTTKLSLTTTNITELSTTAANAAEISAIPAYFPVSFSQDDSIESIAGDEDSCTPTFTCADSVWTAFSNSNEHFRNNQSTVVNGFDSDFSRMELQPREDLFAEDPNYASLNDVQKAVPVSVSKRTSISLIDFTATAEVEPPPPPERLENEKEGNENAIYQIPRPLSGEVEKLDLYSAINVGLKDSFNLEVYGLEVQSVDDPSSLPAPIGVPFTGEVVSPFEDAFSPQVPQAPARHTVSEPASVPQPEDSSQPEGSPQPKGSPQQYWQHQGARQSTLVSFDPLSLAGGPDILQQSPSVSSPEKQKPPPIPPSRRDIVLSGNERSSAARASISYDTPHMPPIPAGAIATVNLEG